MLSDDEDGLMCDFCSSAKPKHRLMALSERIDWPRDVPEIFTINGTKVHGMYSEGDWAACDVCFKLIKSTQKGKLLNRSMMMFRMKFPGIPRMSKHDKSVFRRELKVIHDVFWRNWTGLDEDIKSNE